MKRVYVLILLLMLLLSCTRSTSRLMGNMSEPRDIEIAIPTADVDSVPLLYGFVSDSYENAVLPINLSLRKFIEAEVPYFPLRIPVGRYPTRLSVDRSNKRLFVLNYLDRNISVIDTVKLIERGFGEYRDGEIVYRDSNGPVRKNIDLFASDMKVVYDQVIKKEFLIITGYDDEFKGRIKVFDVDERDSEGVVNVESGKMLYDFVIDSIPTNIEFSSDGDEIYIGSRSEERFGILSLSAGGLFYVSSPLIPDLVRFYKGRLYLIDTVDSRFAIFDTEKRIFIPLLPVDIFGNIYVQPFQTERVRDIAFSPDSNPAGIIKTSSDEKGCRGDVSYILNSGGNIFVGDVDGCSLCEEADIEVARVPCYLKGWYNLPVEDEITRPTVSRPLFKINGKVLSYNEQGLAEYPYIERWNDSERNFGIGISRLFRANMYNRQLIITYEGVIVEGTGTIINGRFVPDLKGFENFNITDADILDLRDINGNALKNCNDGAVVENNEFRIVGLSNEGIEVDGRLPPDDCLERYYFMIRPYKGWTVVIDGYGFLGRAYENQEFNLKDEKGYSHLKFTLRSGKEPSTRGMKFFSTIFIYPYGFSPAEKLFLPSGIRIAKDSIDSNRYWGFVVYTGSQTIWQFSSKDLDSLSSILYK